MTIERTQVADHSQVTTAMRVQELATSLEQDVNNAVRRVSEAEESLRRAHAECAAAKEALAHVKRQHEGFLQTFADTLGITAPAKTVEPTGKLQLVPAKGAPGNGASASQGRLTAAMKLKQVLGSRTLTLDELRAGLKCLGYEVPDVSQVLAKSKDNVLDKSGELQWDADGKLVKRNTFVSPSRGTWRVASEHHNPSVEAVVLSRQEAQLEMIKNRRLT